METWLMTQNKTGTWRHYSQISLFTKKMSKFFSFTLERRNCTMEPATLFMIVTIDTNHTIDSWFNLGKKTHLNTIKKTPKPLKGVITISAGLAQGIANIYLISFNGFLGLLQFFFANSVVQKKAPPWSGQFSAEGYFPVQELGPRWDGDSRQVLLGVSRLLGVRNTNRICLCRARHLWELILCLSIFFLISQMIPLPFFISEVLLQDCYSWNLGILRNVQLSFFPNDLCIFELCQYFFFP